MGRTRRRKRKRKYNLDFRKIAVFAILAALVIFLLVCMISAIVSHKSEYYKDGRKAFDKGNYSEALKDFQAALDEKQLFSSKKDMNIRLYMADVYMKTGEYQLAVSEYDKILEYKAADTGEVKDLQKLASAMYDFSIGNYAGSLEILEKYAETGNTELYMYVGTCYGQIKDYNNMFSAYEKYISEYGFNSYIYAQYAAYYMSIDDYEQALSYVRNGYDSDSTYRPDLMLIEVVYYEKQTDYNTAFNLVKELLADYPDNVSAKREYIFLCTRADEATADELAKSDEYADEIADTVEDAGSVADIANTNLSDIPEDDEVSDNLENTTDNDPATDGGQADQIDTSNIIHEE